MARITVEDCLNKVTNRFGLVLLASRRAQQILGGARVLIDDRRDNKSVVTALREIAAGKVRFMTEEEVAEAKEKAAQLPEPTGLAALGIPGLDLSVLAVAGDDDDDDEEAEVEGKEAVANGQNGGSTPAATTPADEDF